MIEILENKAILKNETQISCLKVLYILIDKIKNNNISINNKNELITDIRNSIGNYIDHRITGVRKIARECAKILNELEIENNNVIVDNNLIVIEHNNIFQKMRNYSKGGKIHKFAQYDNMIVDNLQGDIYKKGMGGLLNLSNFIQKHTKNKTVEKNKQNKNVKYLRSNNILKYNHSNRYPIDEQIFKEEEKNFHTKEIRSSKEIRNFNDIRNNKEIRNINDIRNNKDIRNINDIRNNKDIRTKYWKYFRELEKN